MKLIFYVILLFSPFPLTQECHGFSDSWPLKMQEQCSSICFVLRHHVRASLSSSWWLQETRMCDSFGRPFVVVAVEMNQKNLHTGLPMKEVIELDFLYSFGGWVGYGESKLFFLSFSFSVNCFVLYCFFMISPCENVKCHSYFKIIIIIT